MILPGVNTAEMIKKGKMTAINGVGQDWLFRKRTDLIIGNKIKTNLHSGRNTTGKLLDCVYHGMCSITLEKNVDAAAQFSHTYVPDVFDKRTNLVRLDDVVSRTAAVST